jgi:hypothetical protein
MSFKLTTAEIRLRDELQGELSKAWEEVETAEHAFNKAMHEAKAKVEDAVSAFNNIATHAQSFAKAIADRAQDEINLRSQTWLESENGGEASYWRDEWKCFSIDDIDIDWPDWLDLDEPNIDLMELPEEAACTVS